MMWAYAIVLDWDIETRRQLEIPALRRYHDHLQRRGVSGYSWDELLEDYRLCVAMEVYIATEYCRGGINERWTPYWPPPIQHNIQLFARGPHNLAKTVRAPGN